MTWSWSAGWMGRLTRVHSPAAHPLGRCWCQRDARYREARRAWRAGWIDSPCDGCEGALEAPSYVLQVGRGEFRVACPSCAMELGAAGAEIVRVLA